MQLLTDEDFEITSCLLSLLFVLLSKCERGKGTKTPARRISSWPEKSSRILFVKAVQIRRSTENGSFGRACKVISFGPQVFANIFYDFSFQPIELRLF
jgi:hypothetical protein